jgi:hypothetical protein
MKNKGAQYPGVPLFPHTSSFSHSSSPIRKEGRWKILFFQVVEEAKRKTFKIK